MELSGDVKGESLSVTWNGARVVRPWEREGGGSQEGEDDRRRRRKKRTSARWGEWEGGAFQEGADEWWYCTCRQVLVAEGAFREKLGER